MKTSIFSAFYDYDNDLWCIQEINASNGIVVGMPFWLSMPAGSVSSTMQIKRLSDGKDFMAFVALNDANDKVVVVLGEKDSSNIMMYQSFYSSSLGESNILPSFLLDLRILSRTEFAVLSIMGQHFKLIKIDYLNMKLIYTKTLPHQAVTNAAGAFKSDQYFYS